MPDVTPTPTMDEFTALSVQLSDTRAALETLNIQVQILTSQVGGITAPSDSEITGRLSAIEFRLRNGGH